MEDAHEKPAAWPGQHGPQYPWPFRNVGCSTIRKECDSPPRGSTAREEVEALLNIYFMGVAVPATEDSRAAAGDKEDLNCCRWVLC